MRTSVVGLLLGGVLLLAACGGGDDAPPSAPAPSPSSTTQDEPLEETVDPDPTLTGKPAGRSVTVAGVVRVAPEERCTLLSPEGGGTAWVLVGDTAGLVDGDRVTVTGRADDGTTSRCQGGQVLVVVSAEPS